MCVIYKKKKILGSYNVLVARALLTIQDSFERRDSSRHYRAFTNDFHEAVRLLQKSIENAKTNFVL